MHAYIFNFMLIRGQRAFAIISAGKKQKNSTWDNALVVYLWIYVLQMIVRVCVLSPVKRMKTIIMYWPQGRNRQIFSEGGKVIFPDFFPGVKYFFPVGNFPFW